jgi:hypothetical protein
MLDLALGDEDAGESELAEGAAAGVVAGAEADNLLGMLSSGGELLELLHALRGLGREGGVIEGADPGALCYARAAVSEWQPMRDGERSAAVDAWVARLQETAGRLRLRNATERSAFAHFLELRDDRAAGRRERLSEADPVITAPIWLILGLGGIVAVLLVLVFSDRREHFLVQASLMAAFTTVVAGGLILVWSLDDPYRDTTGSIRPVEMRRSIAIMQERRPSLVLPCTSGGDPRPA